GRKKIGGYPYFDAATGATVYFNTDDILDGAYDSTVYFTIPPFKLDSISSSSQTAVNFKGTFHSGNIFPPIETALTVMPDQSLGFEYVIPDKGFPIYGNKGNFASVIRLDANGLQGKGKIDYLSTNIQADTFTFYLDSVTTTSGVSGAIAENSIFPAAKIGKYTMNWHVSEDKMSLNKPDSLFRKETMDPIAFYNGKYTYTGKATITPNGILGHGTAESDETKVSSPSFEFRQSSFKGNNAEMVIKSTNPDKPALASKDVFLAFDLKKGEAEFSPERAGFASTELPYSQYKTSLSGGKWDFKKKLVTMKEPATNEPGNAFFYSTREDQDTLKFYATSGSYDLSTYTLIAGGVPYIATNDAHVVPKDGIVEITEDADMKVLQDSEIWLDSLSKFHKLTAGEIDVMSRKDFQGFANLEYENSLGNKYPIKFGSFSRDSVIVEKGEPPVYITKAIGSVYEDQKFYILPKILYRGDVHLTSNKQQLEFDGEMKLAFSGDASASDWFPYKNTVNPDSVSISIKKMTAEDGTPLMTGLHISNNSSRIYSTFVSAKADELDLDVFTVEGVLSYDRHNQEFKLSSPARAVEESYQGNVIHYNDVTSVTKYEGSFNLIKNNKDYKLQTSGQAIARMDSSRVNMDAFMAFDINLPGAAWTQMGEFVADNTAGAPEAIGSSNVLLFKLGEFIGTKGVNDYLNRTMAKYVPLPEISPKLVHNLVFNEVKLKWSKKNNAWYSVGPIGLANVGKKDINAMVVGHIEIRRLGESDVVTIYLEANPSTWYYLSYNENALIVASSDDKFNAILAPKLAPPGTLAMSFTPVAGEGIDRTTFVKYFRNTYLGGKGDPIIDTPPPTIIADDPIDEEPAEDTSKKKKKKKDEVEDDPYGGYADEPVEEEPASKKKKKKKKSKDEEQDADTGDFDMGAPADIAPAEPEPEKNKKKEKEKTEAP
ncbi:MAG TPA: hypothetical protein VK927_01030, partial [Adhaeribacter sp.]|nr:hypothetical protein [Adhaeribacter sp.]